MSSYEVITHALCQEVAPEGVYEVFCINCTSLIGTMRMPAILKAISVTAQKGGILCQPCRNSSCELCFVAHVITAAVVDKNGEEKRVCKLCAFDPDLRKRVKFEEAPF